MQDFKSIFLSSQKKCCFDCPHILIIQSDFSLTNDEYTYIYDILSKLYRKIDVYKFES